MSCASARRWMERALTISLSSSTMRILLMLLRDPFAGVGGMNRCDRQRESERGSLSQLTRHGEFSSVESHDFATDEKTETQTHAALLTAVADLVETFEDVRQVILLDPLARVGDGNLDPVLGLWMHADLDLDPPAFRRELQPVVDQVADDLSDPKGIDDHVGEIRRE